MTELSHLPALQPAPAAGPADDELVAVLHRVTARCRPDRAGAAAQGLEAVAGVVEQVRAEVSAAGYGGAGWLAAGSQVAGWQGAGSVAFVASIDNLEAGLNRDLDALRGGAAGLRSYEAATESVLSRCHALEHQLLVAYDDRSRRLAALANAAATMPTQPPEPVLDPAFDSRAGDLLRAARTLLAEVEAAVQVLVACLDRLGAAIGATGGDGTVVAPGIDPLSMLSAANHVVSQAGSVQTIASGSRALALYTAYLRAPQGPAKAAAEARYLASLGPIVGGSALAKASLPYTVLSDFCQVIDPANGGARGWGDRAAGLAGGLGGGALLLTSLGLALGPAGLALGVGGLVVASGWQVGSLVYDHRKEIGDGLTTAWHGVERAGGAVLHGMQDAGGALVDGAEAAGGALVDGAEAAGGALVDGAEAAGGALVDGAEAAGGALVDGAEGVGGALVHGAGRLLSFL